MINQETKERILEACHIEEVIGDFVSLKKRSANLLGVCPFHNERTPSFTVSPAKGFFKCFGCGKAGDSVTFIMEHEHLSFPESLRFLANKYNIEIAEEIGEENVYFFGKTVEEVEEIRQKSHGYTKCPEVLISIIDYILQGTFGEIEFIRSYLQGIMHGSDFYLTCSDF